MSGLACGDKLLRRRHCHFIFGFLVLHHLEVAARRLLADVRGDVVTAKRRVFADVQVAAKRAARRERQVFLIDLIAVAIFDGDVHGRANQLITFLGQLSQDAFEIDLLRGAIDGAIRVDETLEVLIIAAALFIAATAAVEVERIEIGDGEVLALARHDEIRRLLLRAVLFIVRGGVASVAFVLRRRCLLRLVFQLQTQETLIVGRALR